MSIGGFTVSRNPMAAVYEIIRQGINNIHLYAHSNGQGVDELIGAGCVSRLEIAYAWSGRFAPTCIRFKKAVQSGDIVVEDYSNYQMTLRFLAGAMGAKNISAPNSVIFFETGAIDSLLEEVPLAVSDSRVMFRTSVNGNLNSTAIGDYFSPKVRFSGSGGACDVASFVGRTITFMQHEKRKFVQKLDYITSPGWLDGPDGRKKAGLPDGGPASVVTNMATWALRLMCHRHRRSGCEIS